VAPCHANANTDVVLVSRVSPDGPWVPVGTSWTLTGPLAD
jgi:hypothetical protein